MYDDNNVFAKIIRGEMPAFKVFEDARALAFMDAMPQSDGHTLVVPKARARNFFDIEPAVLAELIKTTQHVARGVQKAFNPGGMRIVQFNESRRGPDGLSHPLPHHSLLRRHAAAHAQPRLGGQGRAGRSTPSASGRRSATMSRDEPRFTRSPKTSPPSPT